MDVIDRPVLEGASAVTVGRAFDQFVRTGATVELKAFTGVTGDAGGYASCGGGGVARSVPARSWRVTASC